MDDKMHSCIHLLHDFQVLFEKFDKVLSSMVEHTTMCNAKKEVVNGEHPVEGHCGYRGVCRDGCNGDSKTNTDTEG